MGELSTQYQAVHERLRRSRGRAADHPCSAPDCERSATRWAWQRTGPSVTGDHYGKTLTWGLDLDTYSPMCAPHAAQLDHGGTLTHCPRGHDRQALGVNADGLCRGCDREKARERRAR
ncbi:hypothetical protein SEA_ROBSFEET_81 [Microbacterium phage RobsFeet]|uniref:Uncharacterized protein n=1 Tax=Microbacterium phage RobsFeet TaxID=2201442 RepID=A0A2Z4Q7M0_9CAUD|nr:hypothetical protein HOT43_gp83 [Microbacterium phage RobsFeet]AWY06087.2 hypothetical protein SEA_ROBSFEET_81 [Microbacterium phage RobsFeet]